jgi:hypothetical protein
MSGQERQTGYSQESPAKDGFPEALSAATGLLSSADNWIDELEAVNLQIVQEASQNHEQDTSVLQLLTAPPTVASTAEPVGLVTEQNAKMEEAPEEGLEDTDRKDMTNAVQTEKRALAFEGKRSSFEKIMEALRGGLVELRAAQLSRDEVNQVEDVFMDIKRELYGAEFRGRN